MDGIVGLVLERALWEQVVLGIITLTVVLQIWGIITRPKNAPPVFSTGIPLLGNFLAFAKSPVATVRQGYDKVGTVFTMNMFGNRMTYVLGAQAQEVFFKARDEDMSQAEVYKFMTPVFGKGVVYDAPPRVMQQQLKFMSKSLNTVHLQSYVPKIIKEAEAYFSQWGDSGEVLLLDELAQLIILTASECLMGPEIRQNLFREVAHLYHELDEGISPLSFFFPNAPIPAHMRRDKARKEMGKLFGKVIAERRASGVTHPDVLQVFMDSEYKDGSKPTDDQVTGLLVALLFAGQHTSSITSTWTAMFCMHNPEIMQRVNAEQEDIVGDMHAPLDYDKVNNMDLLHNCMKESIRLFPPLIFLMRKMKTAANAKSSDGKTYTIPAGDTIVASPAVAMSLPQPDGSFSNPRSFDPDRFMGDRKEDQNAKFSYIGFGGGLHACMGERFGYLQVKTILSVLFRNFELEPVSKDLPEADYKAMVVGPDMEHTRVRYRRRK